MRGSPQLEGRSRSYWFQSSPASVVIIWGVNLQMEDFLFLSLFLVSLSHYFCVSFSIIPPFKSPNQCFIHIYKIKMFILAILADRLW